MGQDLYANSLTVYNRSGAVVGSYEASGNGVPTFQWLPDSSGLFIWTTPITGTVPLKILNADASVETTDVPTGNPAAALNGRLLATERQNGSGEGTQIEVADRDGHFLRVVATGKNVHLLGWSGPQIIFAEGQNIYSVLTGGEAPTLLTRLTSGLDDLRQPSSGPSNSPDGSVLVFSTSREDYLQLSGATVRSLPAAVVHTSVPVLWAGPHHGLGLTPAGDLAIVDLSTGSQTSLARLDPNASIQAISGRWVAWLLDSNVYLTNLDTRKTAAAGQMRVAGLIYSLADGSFLLHGGGQSFLIRATP